MPLSFLFPQSLCVLAAIKIVTVVINLALFAEDLD